MARRSSRLHAALRARAGERGVKLTYLPFIVRAVARALKEHPYLNASLDEAGGQILLKKTYNIGIATAAPDGLMVPVLHDADRLDLAAIARGIDRLTRAHASGRWRRPTSATARSRSRTSARSAAG